MKTPKTYRLSPSALKALEYLKALPDHANFTETDIVEQAIIHYGNFMSALEYERKLINQNQKADG